MRKKFKILCIGLAIVIGLFTAFLLFLAITGKGKLTLPVQKKECFEMPEGVASYAQKLTVKDTILVNEEGEQVVLQGVMIPDSRKLDLEGNFTKEYFDKMFACCGNVVRVPIHPEYWENDEYYLWRYLDPIVGWAVENNKYVILDMHFIGNIEDASSKEMPTIKKEPVEFSVEFWNMVANYFRDVPNVIFELYNEPAGISHKRWAENATMLIDIIRSYSAEQIIIVSGVDYSYDLNYWYQQPLQTNNIMYTAHIYPNRKQGLQNLDKLSDKLPIIMSEWGYIAPGEPYEPNHEYLIGDRESFGIPFLKLMEEKGISWVACWYDDGWEPAMFRKDGERYTDWGDLIFEYLRKNTD